MNYFFRELLKYEKGKVMDRKEGIHGMMKPWNCIFCRSEDFWPCGLIAILNMKIVGDGEGLHQ